MSGFKFRTLLVALALSLPLAALAQWPTPDTTARLIGVLPEIDQLRQLSPRSDSADPATRWQILWLHQHVSEQVMAASLQVDATIAQIDNEIARANELRGFLSDRRDRTVSRANLLSIFIGGGVGATSSGLQLSRSLQTPSAAVGIAAGAISSSLAFAGIRAQQGHTSRFDFNSNMLAEFFDPPPLPDSRYPTLIWTFLNESPIAGPTNLTRKQELLQNWVGLKRIDSLSSPEIDHLTSQPSQLFQLTIDDLEDRAAMLQDVRARISFLKRDLGNLLSSLPAVDASTPPPPAAPLTPNP